VKKVKYLKYIMVFSLTLLLTLPVAATGNNSLWSNEAADMYEDRPEYEVGDIITVIINEDASAVQSANTNTSQSSSVEGEAGSGIFGFLKAFGLGYSDQGSAEGETQRTGTLEADITTQINEIMPNGNYQILGNKNIKINGEQQVIKLRGIIRAEDITLDNTISSQKVARADIEYEGQGVVADKQEPGIFKKVLNWFF
jgi:flagellar L-ring protein precursor FlgH